VSDPAPPGRQEHWTALAIAVPKSLTLKWGSRFRLLVAATIFFVWGAFAERSEHHDTNATTSTHQEGESGETANEHAAEGGATEADSAEPSPHSRSPRSSTKRTATRPGSWRWRSWPGCSMHLPQCSPRANSS